MTEALARHPEGHLPSEQKPSVWFYALSLAVGIFRYFLSFFRMPRKLKMMREGRYFIAITFGVGFVGILTGNNLLYVLLGMLLSLIVVSGLLSEACLRNVRVTRRLPMRAQVGRPHLVEIEVHNDKKKMPSYAIEVEDLRAGQPADKRCFFLKVGPGSSQVAAYRRVPAKRGMDRHVGFRVATRFPFGFFEKSRQFDLGGDLLIYPAVDPVVLPERMPSDRGEGGRAIARGRGDEIIGLRVMREGDDPRDIYWRRSTSKEQRIVVERAREVRSVVRLKLDKAPSSGPDPSAAFEKKVREMASRSVAHLRRGDRVLLETTSGERASGSPASGADALLRFLALVDLGEGVPGAAVVSPPAAPPARAPQMSVVPVMPQLSRPAAIVSGRAERPSEPELAPDYPGPPSSGRGGR